MGKLFAKITLNDGSVSQIADEPIQIADDERGIFECVEIDEQPLDGLHVGDIVRHKSGRHFRDVPVDDGGVATKFEDGR